ncbi:phage holin [Fundicoccus culcitae]|uniref:Phage holin n=1 Tax=Fundicoccus culcitae TaxID=2969821 RepID=A0ABY5P8Z2_9LACT|nr:phage holin [Fundicoccus culcitae]UUX35056.1 phage holin [Fundicoccus culcitae]
MQLNNRMYDRAKWLVLVFMPALAVLLAQLGDVFEWQQVDVYVSTLNLLAVFLGSIMQLSSHNYYKDKEEAD